MAEKMDVSGKDLILAIAVTFELSARLSAALSPIYESVALANGRYELRHPGGCGAGFEIIPAAAGVAKVMNLDPETMANAMGIAGYYAMPNTFRKWELTAPDLSARGTATSMRGRGSGS